MRLPNKTPETRHSRLRDREMYLIGLFTVVGVVVLALTYAIRTTRAEVAHETDVRVALRDPLEKNEEDG